jgi:hypothetical protein
MTLVVATEFASFSIQLVDMAQAFAMFAIGLQFIVAGVTGYWYSWVGRRHY